MTSLRINCGSHPSFSSTGSGSSGYFTPVCGLVVKESCMGKDKGANQYVLRRHESDLQWNCKPKQKKSGFLRRLRKKGSRLCGGKMPRRPTAQVRTAQSMPHKEYPGTAKSHNASAILVTSTPEPRPVVERQPATVQAEAAPAESTIEAPVRKRTFGWGASVDSSEDEDVEALVSNQSSSEGEPEPETISLETLKQMSGTWLQDHTRSDGIDEMCDVLELGWVFRKALEKSDMLELDIDDVRIAQVAKIFRLVDLVEKFPLSGEEQKFRRRDLRRGSLHAQTNLTKDGYSTRLWWNDPCKGGMTETFRFAPDGRQMEIDAHIWRDTGRNCTLRTVWTKL